MSSCRAGLGRACRALSFGALVGALVLTGTPDAEAKRTRASYEEEASALQLTLERSPSDHKARLRLTKILLTMKRYEEALTTIKPLSVLSEPPQELELQSLYYRAFIERQLKRYDQSVKSFQAVINTGSNVGLKCDALFGLAKALELKGDPTGSAETYKEFISLEKRPRKAKWVEAAKRNVTRLSGAVVPIERGGADLEGEDKEATPPVQQRQTKAGVTKAGVTKTAPPALDPKEGRAQSTRPKRTSKAPTSDQRTASSSRSTEEVGAKPRAGDVSISQADQRFAKGDYRAAAELYRTLSQGNLPGGDVRANLLHRASVSAFLGGQYRDAQIDAEEALSAQPQGEPLKRTLKGLAVMSALMAPPLKVARSDVRLALREGRFEDALRLTRQLRAKEGTSPDLSRYEGRSLMGLGKYQGAMSALQRASRAGGHPHLSLELAMAAERAGDVKVATRAYREVLQSLKAERRAHSSVAQLASEGLARLGAPGSKAPGSARGDQ